MKKKLKYGLIGYGFMGRTHSNAALQVGPFFDPPFDLERTIVCGRDAAKVETFARRWGYANHATDWRQVIDQVDIVDIVTPNDSHAEIAIAAAQAGKMVMCEKPLAMNGEQGLKMVEAVEAAKVPNTVWYNYRRIPAVSLAKKIVGEGRLGRIFHYRANFLQDWTISPELPQGGTGLWRLDNKVAGSGVTGDLLAHCFDTAIWLNGSFQKVTTATETFIKERKHNLTNQVEPVGIDDAAEVIARFANGSLGNFESTRYARGHKALYTLEINGEKGSLRWDLHDLHRLSIFDHNDAGDVRGWKSIHVTDGDHPYMKNWWVPGLAIGYAESFVHQLADFLYAVANEQPCGPTFRDALETQRVCDAVLLSGKSEKWESVQAD